MAVAAERKWDWHMLISAFFYGQQVKPKVRHWENISATTLGCYKIRWHVYNEERLALSFVYL